MRARAQARLISSRSSLPGLKCGTVLAGTTTPGPGLGVAAGAAVAPADAEAAEAAQLDLVALLQGVDDRGEDGVDDDLGVLAGEVGDLATTASTSSALVMRLPRRAATPLLAAPSSAPAAWRLRGAERVAAAVRAVAAGRLSR